MTPRQSIILACIGLAIIITYVVYLGIYFGLSKPPKTQEQSVVSEEQGVDTNMSCSNVVNTDAKQCPSCPKAAPCPTCPVCPTPAPAPAPVASTEQKCTPDYDDAATRLTKNLMISAKKVTTDQGLDDQYYHQLLLAVYKRFNMLNKTLLQQEETTVKIQQPLNNKDKALSLKFLEKLKKEIIQYEEEEAKTPKPVGQAGGTYNVSSKDVKTVLNSNEDAICSIYSCLKN